MLPAGCHQKPRSAAPAGDGRRHQQPPMAEVRVRDQNLQMQLRLQRAGAKFERDRGAWGRENDKRQRGVLLDLARMLDTRLSPSVDDWFAKRRLRQVSRLGDGGGGCGVGGAGADENDEAAVGRQEAAEERQLDRQRLLDMKRRDWCGVTSVAIFSAKQQLQQQPADPSDEAAQPPEQQPLHGHRHHHHRVQGASRPKTAGPVLVRTK